MYRPRFKKVTRWKVANNVHRSDLAKRLNKLAAESWEIVDVIVCYGRFTVVAKRQVRVKV